MSLRKTQAERRAETQAIIMKTATQLFGEKGYNNTSVEDIAQASGMSIAPVFHYYKTKLNLFKAVSEALEEQIVPKESTGSSVGAAQILASWRKFIEVCADPYFRRIILVDGPNVLGRDRMYQNKVAITARELMLKQFGQDGLDGYKGEILSRMTMGALAETGFYIGQAENTELAVKEAEELVETMMTMLGKASAKRSEAKKGNAAT